MIEKLREKANRLPLLPGVYMMKDAEGTVIYVGKAKKLKNRVSSYFRGEHLPKVEAMVQKAADFEVIVADSEFEALVLENSLIKRHMPTTTSCCGTTRATPSCAWICGRSTPGFPW